MNVRAVYDKALSGRLEDVLNSIPRPHQIFLNLFYIFTALESVKRGA